MTIKIGNVEWSSHALANALISNNNAWELLELVRLLNYSLPKVPEPPTDSIEESRQVGLPRGKEVEERIALSKMEPFTTSFVVGEEQTPNELVFTQGGQVQFRVANLWNGTRISLTPENDHG